MRRLKNIEVLSAAALVSVVVLGAGQVSAEDYGPLKPRATTLGSVLADPNGMTVYTYDKDSSGASTCYGECAEYWPPVAATASDKPVGDMTIVKRTDGKLQWADGGKPLYTFANDKKPGDVTGENKNGVWHVVKGQ
jgi:predicted lipoprotein with Yx(FWY)xxD motif